VTVEQAVAEEYGREVPLANDRTLSQQGSPFRTVRTLADFIAQRLETQNA